MKHILSTVCLILCFGACSPAEPVGNSDAFFSNLLELCQKGEAYSGRLVSSDEADADFAELSLIAHFRSCSEDEIRIPFHVGEDRSRTWVITPQGGGLRLKHDHRHEDGLEDAVTQYGGDSGEGGSAKRQFFPADGFSKELFEREGLNVSVTNVWAIDHDPSSDLFAYEMRRPNRFFRVEFDLSAPVDVPPAPWGAQ